MMAEITDPELLKRLNEARTGYPTTAPQPTAGGEPAAKKKFRIGNEIDLLQGVSQGLIDPIEGIVQLAEKSTGWKMAPESLRNWARDWRDRSGTSALGTVGRVAGNVGPALMTGGVGEMPMAARFISGAVMGGMQPVSGSADYWKTKLGQVGLGGIGGASLPAMAAAVSKAPWWVAEKGLRSVGVPKALTKFLAPSESNALTNLAERVGPGATGRVAGEYRGTHPYELQRTSEGLPYYQAKDADKAPKTKDQERTSAPPKEREPTPPKPTLADVLRMQPEL